MNNINNINTRPFVSDIFYIIGYNDLRIMDYITTLICIGHGKKSCVLLPTITKVMLGPHADNRYLICVCNIQIY